MRQSSWVCTIFIQLSLCVAIYVSLHLGHSLLFSGREADNNNGNNLDLHFITVAGGFRPLHQQNHLLKLMGSVAKSYNARFVVSISELGEEDPLFRNATRASSPLKLPWYTKRVSKDKESRSFAELIKLPPGGTLDIVFVGTGSSQQGSANRVLRGSGIGQLNELTRTLKAADADWRLVVGSDPFFVDTQGQDPKEVKQDDRTIHQILTKYGVNVYLSDKGCTSGANQNDVACIAIPNPTDYKRSSSSKREMEDGFLLHRVSFSEFVTYFINSSGQVMDTRLFKQKGKEAM